MVKYTHAVGAKSAEIEVLETENPVELVMLSKKKYLQDKKAEYFSVRKVVAEKLDKASESLPVGYQFKIFETFRSFEKQVSLWNAEIEKITLKHPNWSTVQIETEANNGIANPYGIGSGHQTGAAIDITICYNGVELDMGTSYLDTNNSKTPTFSKGLTPQQEKNRKWLHQLMAHVGLVNYEAEWWHYSYGEQEWVVITDHKQTLFKAIKEKVFEKIREN